MSASASPLGEGRLDFPAKRYPSFWERVKEQKHGLGNMALSASIAFLAVSIIKQEKELTREKESAGQLRQQNEALNERLEKFNSVFKKSEAGEETASEVLALLRDVVASNTESRVDSPADTGTPLSLARFLTLSFSRSLDPASLKNLFLG